MKYNLITCIVFLYSYWLCFADYFRHVLHKYANEDVSLGSWFIGLDVLHIDDRRLCCGTPPGKNHNSLECLKLVMKKDDSVSPFFHFGSTVKNLSELIIHLSFDNWFTSHIQSGVESLSYQILNPVVIYTLHLKLNKQNFLHSDFFWKVGRNCHVVVHPRYTQLNM